MHLQKDNKYFKVSLCAFLVIAASVVLVLIAMNLSVLMRWLSLFADIVSPFIWGFCFAYILNYPYNWLYRILGRLPKINKKISAACKKIIAVILVYAGFISIAGLFFYMVVPQIARALTDFMEILPTYAENFAITTQAFLFKYLERFGMSFDDIYEIMTEIGKRVTGGFELEDFVSKTIEILLSTSVGIKNIFLGLIVSVYFLLDKERFILSGKKILYASLPKHVADKVLIRLDFTDKTFGSFFISKGVDSIIIGLLTYVFMLIMRMDYAVLISVLIGVTNVIPFFGPFIGAIPAVFLLLLVNPWHALIFGIFSIVLQQFDGNYLGPKLMGDSMGIRAVFVVFAVIVGGGLFGVIGMFVGVPLFVVLYSMIAETIRDRLKKKKIDIKKVTVESVLAHQNDPVSPDTGEDAPQI